MGRTPQNQHPAEPSELVSDGIGTSLKDASWSQGVFGETEALYVGFLVSQGQLISPSEMHLVSLNCEWQKLFKAGILGSWLRSIQV